LAIVIPQWVCIALQPGQRLPPPASDQMNVFASVLQNGQVM
jgi:hypothetical protein